MKTKNIALSFLLTLGLSTIGCTDGFDAINTNPYEPTDDMYDFSKTDLGGILKDGAVYEHGAGAAEVHQRVKALGYDIFSQYTIGNSVRKYTPNDGYSDLYWKTHYNNWLSILNLIIKDAQIYEGRENSMALARIWRVFLQSRFIDFFGPAPFPKDPEDDNPPYEALKDQFDFFFSELDEAVKQFDPKGDFISGEDQIYWGNMDKWKRFANTLRLRLAIQVSEIDPNLCKTQAQAAFDADGGILNFDEDARVAMEAPGRWGRQYPYYMYQVTWSGPEMMTTSMEKVLTNIGGMPYIYTNKSGEPVLDADGKIITPDAPTNVDPRGTRMFDPGTKASNYKWAGMTPGLNDVTDDLKAAASRMSQIWIIPNDQRNTDIFLYSEACFLAAEATERFAVNSGKSAKMWYEEGVQASFNAWGLSEQQAIQYLASNQKNSWGTSANYDDTEGAGNTKLEKIITQKYIAGYPDISAQAWNDKRRLNLPAFDIPEIRDGGSGTYPNNNNILDASNFIQRMPYPQGEKLINEENYNAGVSQLDGGDKTSSVLWWASKRSNYCTSVNP